VTGGGPQPVQRPATAPRSPSIGTSSPIGAAGAGPTLQQQQAEAQARYQRLQQQQLQQLLDDLRRQLTGNGDAQVLRQIEAVQRSMSQMESQPTAGRDDSAPARPNGTRDGIPGNLRDAVVFDAITDAFNQIAGPTADVGSGSGTLASSLPESRAGNLEATDPDGRDKQPPSGVAGGLRVGTGIAAGGEAADDGAPKVPGLTNDALRRARQAWIEGKRQRKPSVRVMSLVMK